MPPTRQAARFAKLNHLRAGNDRLNAAAAETIDGQRRAIKGNTRFQGDVPRAINRVAGSLQCIADDCVIDFFGGDAGCFQRGA